MSKASAHKALKGMTLHDPNWQTAKELLTLLQTAQPHKRAVNESED